jgi:hypothetical protein
MGGDGGEAEKAGQAERFEVMHKKKGEKDGWDGRKEKLLQWVISAALRSEAAENMKDATCRFHTEVASY